MATEPHESPAAAGTEKSATAARQGVISGRVILVLLASLLFVVVALGVSYCSVH